jgi:mono/diheme cytochrome c family protein
MTSSARRIGVAFGVAAAGLLAAGMGPAASPSPDPAKVVHGETGSVTFTRYCAACHGREARGDGPLAASLRVAPPDLTRLARRNRGKFDAEKVARIIDGRDLVAGHGDSDMPIWGDAFKRTSEGYSEEKVQERIKGLVEHLRSIQVQ